MSTAAPPTIPPRPVKQQAAAQGVSKLPDIPPRPASKRIERSISPSNFPRSPLNDPYVPLTNTKSIPLAARIPSVHHLPTPGEEGMEYANIQYTPSVPSSALAQEAAAQTRTIGDDVQLHAPKPSLPKSSAAAQVENVTRTDSAAAVSHGIGKHSTDDLTLGRTRSRQSISRPDSAASGERRRSIIYGDEQGPAEMGLRVPINPLLGDVQAPTPQGLSPQATGESGRKHSRRRSQMDDFRPPDAYGLHGHGVIANTKFERDWYQKHPDQLEHEEGHGHGVYEGIGSGRGSYALSSDELNKIVRNTASRGSGFGAKNDINSYPDEQIGYMASETYQRSQQTTPHPESLSRVQTHSSQANIESPLRRTSFPADDASPAEIRRKRASLGSDKAVADDEDAHHISEPLKKFNKITGGQESLTETQDARPYVIRQDEHGNEYRVPILAEDEVAKDIGGEFMHPAISPKFERRGSVPHDEHGSGAITPTSRPGSRPGSIYQLHSASHSLSRFLSHQDEREHLHTPLEDVAEYEPLFEETEEKKALSHAERFKKRPDALTRRFPSQDIWEDTPSSAMYVAEVSTPDLPSQVEGGKSEPQPTSYFERPEVDQARKGEVPEEEKKKLISKEERLAKSKWAPHLRDDMPTKSRPGLANRFPSQDIWEDTAESHMLTTTVGGLQLEEEASPVETKAPQVPDRPAKSRLGEGASSQQVEPSVAPSIPARPPKRTHQVPPADAKLTEPQTLSREVSPTEIKKTPSLPDRPKPSIPPRPAKKAENEELTKVTSAGSAESTDTQVPAAKQKPQVPARPAGGNFASLKGNFMSDLNKKLGLGPPKEKEKEPEPQVEAKPLEDARKGRARGPQRRAPAKSPAAAEVSKPPTSFSMFAPIGIWHINDSDELETISEAKEESDPKELAVLKESPAPKSVSIIDHAENAEVEPALKPEQDATQKEEIPLQLVSNLATNTAGEPADPIPTGEAEDDNGEGELTRKTTATTVSGDDVDREESPAAAHMLPASQMTTASDGSDLTQSQTLGKVPTRDPELQSEIKAEDEPIKVRNEQVGAAAPDPPHTHSVTGNTNNSSNHPKSIDLPSADPPKGEAETEEDPGSDTPKEPMTEEDVDYDQLEKMTAMADGKTTADEDPQAAFSSRKIVD